MKNVSNVGVMISVSNYCCLNELYIHQRILKIPFF